MAHRSTFTSWLIRLITWDGVLPATVWSVPFLIRLLIPNHRGPIELAAVVLPIAAFFVRYRVGRRYISSNDCGAVVRLIQVTVFCLGIFVLVLIDALVMLSHVMPKGGFFGDGLVVLAVPYGIYLTAMAFAMYPGLSDS